MKPAILSGRNDVKALDGIFKATENLGHDSTVRLLRFFCHSQGITAKHVFPEIYKPEDR